MFFSPFDCVLASFAHLAAVNAAKGVARKLPGRLGRLSVK
jgi:hypothetical protein